MVDCRFGVKLELEQFLLGSSAIILARELIQLLRILRDFLCYWQLFLVESGIDIGCCLSFSVGKLKQQVKAMKSANE
jgi:hypothetical protein